MSSSRILVVDDEPDIRNLVHEILEDEGYEVQVAENAAAARQARRQRRPDLILLDIWMPDVDGVTLLKEWTDEGGPSCPVVMMSGHGTVETAVEATRLGAFDFIEKPLSLAKLLLTVDRALSQTGPRYENPRGVPPAPEILEPVGRSALMRDLREQAKRLAPHDSAVVVSGEVGAGRKSVARYLHSLSHRQHGPVVEFNGAAQHEDEAERALFGSEHSGNVVRGCLEQAAAGSVILFEPELSHPGLQRRLLDAVQSGRFYRVGGSTPVSLAARLIAVTENAREGLFLQLNMVPLHIPALREHREDVPELLAFWADRLVEREKLPYRHFTLAAQNRLRNYEWPGNIRELRNLVQRLLVMGRGEEIGQEEVESLLAEASPPVGDGDEVLALPLDMPLRDAREQFERLYLQHQLKRAQGSVGRLAKLTGMERTHLYRKLKALGIDPKEVSS
ncbi:transcriptional regulator [Alkalilimnicola ehrlichii]|uniref:sigma-54-dependent transcriptional regulator n=1 Tax=Alkalilimnicola ehrlichii TaxID=351052 RepID=UPI000E2F702A|nr:sigma-54 dependent transcriptional regulator [Alkalilimnicola ehrlichii]RFA24763.1 transcriptional regulator [Alkalilimnicola ehrlichii]